MRKTLAVLTFALLLLATCGVAVAQRPSIGCPHFGYRFASEPNIIRPNPNSRPIPDLAQPCPLCGPPPCKYGCIGPRYLVPVSPSVLTDSLPATVVRVHDGDTLIVDIANVPVVFGKAIGVRITGIDTPEMKAILPRNRELARMAQARVVALVDAAGGKVTILNPKREKYFRVLGVVMVGQIDVGQTLLNEGLARPYNGRGPKPW